ncbi:inositol monophosphatase [candidate division KSB1 bacterium]|nr:inositol monophosphatase [candidate division KSB1 bacterium]RQW07572.1 MAG: inositol monophosphatase [candidate division KSB1 bacterium]
MKRQNELGRVAIKAARAAGDIIMANVGTLTRADIETKSRSDFVTTVDKKSEECIINIIYDHFPDHKIYAEESLRQAAGGYRWIIDPLDGTTNYIHGVPIFSVSIGVQYKGDIILGVVYDPTRDELFYAEKGEGAFLNGRTIRVSSLEQPELALLATGYPFRMKEHLDLYQESFKRLFLQVSGIRRAGSAAIDLCYVACGRFDGFWELGLHAWDIAAACIILAQAGGQMTDFDGGESMLETGNTIASNGKLHPVLLRTIKDVFNGVLDR